MDDPVLLASVSQIAATHYGMFGFYDEEDGGTEPVHPHGWYAATTRTVRIYPACQLPSPGIRFERWTAGPPRQVTDSGDDPEVRARLKFQVTQGSIGLMADGSQPGVFALPVGWHHLELLGYRLSVMPAKEKDLYARRIAPGDIQWKQAEGVELYVARFWPACGPAALPQELP
ncbi:hypothetical protein ACFVH6_14440 [Spirillospora sp. NPDC127200]